MSGPLCAARAAAAACLVTSLIAHPQDLGHGDRDVATGFQHRGFAAPPEVWFLHLRRRGICMMP